MNRRRFLRHTGAAMAAGVVAPVAFRFYSAPMEWAQTAGAPGITAVLFEERYRDCRIFADALAALGAQPFAINGNSAAPWYGPLRVHLASVRGVVAGLTAESDRGVSLACGRELHLTRVYEGAHDARRSSSIVHRIQAAAHPDEIAAALRRAHESWSESLALVLHRTRFLGTLSITSPALTGGSGDRIVHTSSLTSDFPGYLTSWLLATPPSI